MKSSFENGIKIIFLLLLTNAYSSSADRKEDQDMAEWKDYLRLKLGEDSYQLNREDKRDHFSRYRNRDRVRDDRDRYEDDRDRIQEDRESKYSKQQYSDRGDMLSRLLNNKQGNVVVFLNSGADSNNILSSFGKKSNTALTQYDKKDNNKDQYYGSNAENDAYVFYSILRTTRKEEDLDPEADGKFEKTMQLLRSAFALRCARKDDCVMQCKNERRGCNSRKCYSLLRAAGDECEKKCPEEKKECDDKCTKIVKKEEDKCKKEVKECEKKEKVEEKKCEKKCEKVIKPVAGPPYKPKSPACPNKFDELDSCDEKQDSCGKGKGKNECKGKSKCKGKTMPPYWLLRALNTN